MLVYWYNLTFLLQFELCLCDGVYSRMWCVCGVCAWCVCMVCVCGGLGVCMSVGCVGGVCCVCVCGVCVCECVCVFCVWCVGVEGGVCV